MQVYPINYEAYVLVYMPDGSFVPAQPIAMIVTPELEKEVTIK